MLLSYSYKIKSCEKYLSDYQKIPVAADPRKARKNQAHTSPTNSVEGKSAKGTTTQEDSGVLFPLEIQAKTQKLKVFREEVHSNLAAILEEKKKQDRFLEYVDGVRRKQFHAKRAV